MNTSIKTPITLQFKTGLTKELIPEIQELIETSFEPIKFESYDEENNIINLLLNGPETYSVQLVFEYGLMIQNFERQVVETNSMNELLDEHFNHTNE